MELTCADEAYADGRMLSNTLPECFSIAGVP